MKPDWLFEYVGCQTEGVHVESICLSGCIFVFSVMQLAVLLAVR